jgi:hypothetical protein
MVVIKEEGLGEGCNNVGPNTIARLVAYIWLVDSKSVTLFGGAEKIKIK